MIYLAKGVENYYKIGYTKSEEYLKNRVKSLQTYCPVEIVIVKTIKGTLDDEKEMHTRFDQYREKGEWFKFSDFLVKKACETMDMIEEKGLIKEKEYITITEYDYRFNDGSLEYRHTENCYELMDENSIHYPGTLHHSCFEWKKLTIEGIKQFTINEYRIFYNWMTKLSSSTTPFQSGHFALDKRLPVIFNDEWFEYYVQCHYNLSKILKILCSKTIKEDLYGKIDNKNGNSDVWQEVCELFYLADIDSPKESKESRQKIQKGE